MVAQLTGFMKTTNAQIATKTKKIAAAKIPKEGFAKPTVCPSKMTLM